jgi:hypothetical protein
MLRDASTFRGLGHGGPDNLLRNRKQVSLLCGSPHPGKSTIARQLAIAVAHGQPFLGRETVQGKVLYWQSEETLEDAKEDFTRSRMLPTDDARLVIMHPESDDKHLTDLAKVLDERPRDQTRHHRNSG